MIVVEDILSDVVKKSSVVVGFELSFQYGTLREIVENLNTLGKGGKVKYPLVALIEPFKQRITDDGARSSLRLLIATMTKKTLKADERLEQNYKPILFPAYEALIGEIKKVTISSTLDHTLINHFEMGRESLQGYDKAILDDHIDAIEINDMNVLFRENKCNNLTKNF